MAEHAVIVVIASIHDDADAIEDLEDSLLDIIDAAGLGELDGHDSGEDGAVLYMYGTDADRLWEAVEPAIRAAGLGAGSYIVKRYGNPGATEVRIDLP